MRHVQAPNSVGRIFETGTELASLLDKIDANFVETENNFVHAATHKKIAPDQFKKWSDLASEWHTFYAAHTDQTFTSPWEAAATADVADSYDVRRAGLQAWLKTLAPDEVIGPDPIIATPETPPPGPPWGLIAGAIIALAVAYTAGPLLRGLGSKATAK